MPLLLVVSLFTLLDFVVLFSVGSEIGLLYTLILIFVTGVGGLHLIRREGAYNLARAREKLNAGELPSSELLTGAALIFGGALLMAPGFLSDALGLACLVPNARRLMLKLLAWFGVTRLNAQSAANDPETNRHHGKKWRSQKPHGSDQAEEQGRRAESKEPLEGDFISRDESRR